MNYKQLINAVLKEINEVQITTVSGATGIQASVADFVNKAQRDIINSEVEWPFTVVSQSFTSVAGTGEYSRESDAKTLDYDSFRVRETASTAQRTLQYLSYDEYVDKYNEFDSNPSGDSQGLPQFVYETPDQKIGLSPIPDLSTYTINYYYYQTSSDMSADADTPTIPERFHDVIVNRARYYAHMLRSDAQFSQFEMPEYAEGINRMRVELITKKDYLRAV